MAVIFRAQSRYKRRMKRDADYTGKGVPTKTKPPTKRPKTAPRRPAIMVDAEWVRSPADPTTLAPALSLPAETSLLLRQVVSALCSASTICCCWRHD